MRRYWRFSREVKCLSAGKITVEEVMRMTWVLVLKSLRERGFASRGSAPPARSFLISEENFTIKENKRNYGSLNLDFG